MSARILRRLVLHGGLDRLIRLVYGGKGMIFSFHQVLPNDGQQIDLSHIITPDELDTVLHYFQNRGWKFVSMDDIPGLLGAKRKQIPFVALTFDDGYVDTMEYALPVMERYEAPFTVYVSTGPRQDNLTLWLKRLEQMIASRCENTLPEPEGIVAMSLQERSEKISEYNRVMRHVLHRSDGHQDVAASMLEGEFRDVEPLVPMLMTSEQIRILDRHPLATIGAHTITHANLAALRETDARREIEESKKQLENMLGHQVLHFAYPFGAAGYAGAREFRLAREAGYRTAVTYRHAHLFRAHAEHLHALPRLIVDIGACRDPRLLKLYECGYVAMKTNRYRRVVIE